MSRSERKLIAQFSDFRVYQEEDSRFPDNPQQYVIKETVKLSGKPSDEFFVGSLSYVVSNGGYDDYAHRFVPFTPTVLEWLNKVLERNS